MKNKKEVSFKQILPLIGFSIVFFVCMTIMLAMFVKVAFFYDQRRLKTRLEYAAANEKVVGTDSTLRDLISSDDYEKEFDDYWEFANVRLAYINAKYGTNKPESLELIKKYSEGNYSKARVVTAQKYLERLKE